VFGGIHSAGSLSPLDEFTEVVAIHSCGESTSLAKASRSAVLQFRAPEPQASDRATTWSTVAFETVLVQVSSKSDCQEPESGWQSEPVSTSVPSRSRTYCRAVQPSPTLDQCGNRSRS
jgi:hypothetical protein